MARPRTFDSAHALEAALLVFWRQGYEATSIGDLVAATGVSRSSLYADWGSKDGLFEAALSLYGETMDQRWLARLRTGSCEAIRRQFAELTDAALGEGRGMSCFVLNTLAERAAHDERLAVAIREQLDQVQGAFREALATAVQRGELPPATDIESHAAHLALAMQALLLQSKTGAPRRTLDAFVALTLAALDAPLLLPETS